MALPKEELQLSAEQYLELEETSDVRHEYLAGRIFAMVGATEAHNTIVANLHLLVGSAVRGSGCRAFVADMKVRVESTKSFYYPDLMVTCEPYSAKSVYKTSPTIIFEVLSPATQDIDRREKLLAYRTIDSLAYYAIVYQSERRVELYERLESGEWNVSVLTASDTFALHPKIGLSVSLNLDEIYQGILD